MRIGWCVLVSLLALGCAGRDAGSRASAQPSASTEEQPILPNALAEFEAAQRTGQRDPRHCRHIAESLEAEHRATGLPLHRFHAGVVWEFCGEWSRAAAAFASIDSDDPMFAAAQNNLGVLAHRERDYEKAGTFYGRALQAQRRMPSALYNVGTLHRERYRETGELGEFGLAQHAFQDMLLSDPPSVLAYVGLASLFRDRAARGESSYLALARFALDEARGLEQLTRAEASALDEVAGTIALLEGHPDRALQAFESAAVLAPREPGPRINAAHVRLQVREFEGAARHLAAASALVEGEHAVDVALASGVAAVGRGRSEEAREAYEDAARRSTFDPRPHYNLGVLLKHGLYPSDDGAKPLRDAERHFERFLQGAGQQPRYAAAVEEAQRHLAELDLWLRPIHTPPNREAERLEALHREQQKQERIRLLELERRAKKALASQPRED